MQTINVEYSKKRREFGVYPNFTDTEMIPICDIKPTVTDDDSTSKNNNNNSTSTVTTSGDNGGTGDTNGSAEASASMWQVKPLSVVSIDCIPSVSEHEANTERFIQVDRSMHHSEGGWPLNVNTQEFSEKQRYIRKMEADEMFQQTMVTLSKRVEKCVVQNNAIDMFEEFFADIEEHVQSEPPSAKTVTVLKDPSQLDRNIAKVCWHPDSPSKLAVAHASMSFDEMNRHTFQSNNIFLPPSSSSLSHSSRSSSASDSRHSESMARWSAYIWDLNNPNRPDFTLIGPQSPLCSIAFNHKSSEQLIGGCYNGLIGFWDLRRGSMPCEKTNIKFGHSDPVLDVYWIQSRSNTEFVSVSTDGYLHWWDTRSLGSGPKDSMLLKDEHNGRVYGGTCLEYRPDGGATKYLVGTEQGSLMIVERKAKKDGDSVKQIKTIFESKHHSPVYNVQRNFLIPKCILSIGDWTHRMWMDDTKTNIITGRYDSSYLSSGCWSPTRAGVFATANHSGCVDIWDYYYKQTEPVVSMKVSDVALTDLSMQSKGQLLAIGDSNGQLTVLELSDSLCEPAYNEKAVVSQLLEREQIREKTAQAKILAQRRLIQIAKKKQKSMESQQSSGGGSSGSGNNGGSGGASGDDSKEDDNGSKGGSGDMKSVEEEFLRMIEKSKPPKFERTLRRRTRQSMSTTTSQHRTEQ